jgi:hypothetical protein
MPEMNITVNQCPMCTKMFNSKAHLNSHLFKRKKSCYSDKSNILENKMSMFVKKNIKSDTCLKCILCTEIIINIDDLYTHIIECGGVKKSILDKTYKNPIDDNFLKSLDHLPQKILTLPQYSSNNNDSLCAFCGKMISRKDNLIRHLNTCKVKKNDEIEHSDIFNSLMEKMNALEKENKKLQKSITSMSNRSKKVKNTTSNDIKTNYNNISNNSNNSNNNSNNTINNTINIIGFGKEKLDYTDEVVKSLLSHGFNAVTKTIEYTNFNENKPQFHNVYIPNIKSPYAAIFNGEEWKLDELNIVLDQLYDDKRCYLEDKFDEFILSLNKVTKKKFQRFINNDDEDSPQAKRIKKKIKLMLYNKRKIPMKTMKTMI